MQTIQLQNLGVSELAANEFETITGGEWPSWKSITWAAVASEVVEHWDELKQGFADGWNAVKID